MPGVTQKPSPESPPALREGSMIPEHLGAKLMRAIRESQALPGLASLARDLAAWTETVEADSCNTEILADLEELGRRAHELVRAMDGEGA